MAFETGRGAAAQALSERVLRSVTHALGGDATRVVVVGGLVPPTLVHGIEPPAPIHLGTEDVDLSINLLLQEGAEGFVRVERALRGLGFSPDPKIPDGWRWLAVLDGRHTVKLEFLADRRDTSGSVALSPRGYKGQLRAANLHGSGFATQDNVTVISEGPGMAPDDHLRVEVKYAGIGAFLLAKAYAIEGRGAEKDYYDFAYALLYNDKGGPVQAASSVLEGPLVTELAGMRRILAEVADRFGHVDRAGPAGFATQSLLVDPGADASGLKQAAVLAVGAFMGVVSIPRP